MIEYLRNVFKTKATFKGLGLDILRAANERRQELWCPDPSQVPDLMFRATELGGEVGEALNVVKKLEREARGWVGSRASKDDLAAELADVIICCDLVAMQAGINLSDAVIDKFNATSDKVDIPIYITKD